MVFRILKEFLDNSTIHGLVHISTAKSRASRAAWVAIVVACFAFAIYMIVSSYKKWQESPVSTTITTHPITELEFPTVTVCPPWGSNTALNHLLHKVRDVNFTDEMRTTLRSIAKEVFIEIPDKKNRNQMMGLLSLENMRSIADGQINLPEVTFQKEGDEELLHMHYRLDLPDNIEELVGDDQLVLDVRSEQEWSYRLLNEKYSVYTVHTLYSQERGKTMFDAENFCQIWHSHISSVGSKEEQDEIEKLAINGLSSMHNEIWLGGTRTLEGTGWQWLDGRDWTYQKWDFEEPNNETGYDCIAYRKRNAWFSGPCTLLQPFICQSARTMKVGNQTFSMKGALGMRRTFHLWRNVSKEREVSEFVPRFWIEENETADDQELVSREVEGSITTPGLGTTPPPDYYEKMHKFTAVVELPKNFTKIIGDGALVVDLDVSFPDGQPGNEVQVLVTGPKLEYFNLERDWYSAEKFCVSRGGHLASVPSPYHWQRFLDFIEKQGLEEDLWLGGSDEKAEGDWRWSDGNKWSDEEHWRIGMPSNLSLRNCLKTRYGKWYDTHCTGGKSFVCEVQTTQRIGEDTQLVFTSKNLTAAGIQVSWVAQPLETDKTPKKKVLVYTWDQNMYQEKKNYPW